MWRLSGTVCFAVVFWILGSPAWSIADDFHSGQAIILKAAKPVGVPLHHAPAPSFRRHVADHSTGIVREVSEDGRWVFVVLDSGESGWVARKYVRERSLQVPAEPSQDTLQQEERAVWTSRDECWGVVNRGNRMVSSAADHLRIATWNIRWFPLGTPPDQFRGPGERTDLDWLKCVVLWMHVDVLAVQESLATPEAQAVWEKVLATLHEKTGQAWRWSLQRCGDPDHHHIGLLWNADRVHLTEIHSLWRLNSKASSESHPCEGGLRPGHHAYVQSRRPHGADFHLIVLHLKSGPTVFAVEERHKALNRIDQTVAPLLRKDLDIVILGDFNTMGAGDWRSRISELKNIRRLVRKGKPGFHDLPLTPQCSHYFRGRGGWLDHVLVANSMGEATESSAQVTGYCALAGCRKIRGDYPLAYRRLSDHCPVVFTIRDHDDDS